MGWGDRFITITCSRTFIQMGIAGLASGQLGGKRVHACCEINSSDMI
jgi:hypothetical protein